MDLIEQYAQEPKITHTMFKGLRTAVEELYSDIILQLESILKTHKLDRYFKLGREKTNKFHRALL